MKAAVFHEVNQPLQMEEVDIASPGPREVLVRTRASGVCHSDLHFVEGLYTTPVPAVLGQPALRLYLLAEHTGCPFVPDMLRNSRTTRSNWLARRLAWNMPYHAEHHAYPALPFHALPAAHNLLKDRIEVQASGYAAAHRDILAYILRKSD